MKTVRFVPTGYPDNQGRWLYYGPSGCPPEDYVPATIARGLLEACEAVLQRLDYGISLDHDSESVRQKLTAALAAAREGEKS